ncbi:MAG: DegV family EDD domain-containing protein [Lactococcus plantarum]|nr:DegV family EDD domain-containing protein [Lactococcus plantarum]MDN6085082.1 DegV family EDD domain-containing protein [Lactococcus plantarum]
MNELTVQRLCQSIFSGAKLVIQNKIELNDINVFPVADGDTGSNLASLMQAILNDVPSDNQSIKSLLDKVSSAAIIGARGNSGLIFAQYLSGLAENYQEEATVDSSLVKTFKLSVPKAYDAVENPKEGTILSVMRVWAESLTQHFKQTNSFSDALSGAHQSIEKAVLDTKLQLAVLTKNNIVDSGAKGFYYFVTGFTTAFCSEPQEVDKDSEPLEIAQDKQVAHLIADKPTYRYCTEFILNDVKLSISDIRAMIASLGDSLIVIGNQDVMKLHIHTNQPKQILALLEPVALVSYQKVDDMLIQYMVTQYQTSRIAIVTDSIADLPQDYTLQHQVHCLPINIMSDGQAFLDKLTLDMDTIDQKIKAGQVLTTSQPSIQTVDALLSFLEDKYDHVLVLTVSKKLSGTYQLIAQRIKEKQLSEDWIQLVDSRTNSVAQGLLVKKAVALAEQETSFSDLVAAVQDYRAQTFIYVAVADLNPMIKSGRIPKVLGQVANRLSIVPIVSLDEVGAGILKGVGFSQKHNINKIVKLVRRMVRDGHLAELSVTHVSSPKVANRLAKRLASITNKPCEVVDCSGAIAISAGSGSIAVAGMKKEL